LSFKKTFDTSGLLAGNYILELEAVYPDTIARSSSQFSVVDVTKDYSKLIYILGIMVLVILIVLVIWRVNLTSDDLTGKNSRSGNTKQ